MRTVEFEVHGQTLHLCLNGAALFDIYDKFGSEGFVTDHIQGNSRKSLTATCWMLSKLAEQGELVRRFQGFDHEKWPSAERLQVLMKPLDIPAARRAIEEAVRLGFAREEQEDEEIDLGLLELQKKTAEGSPGPDISR